jgi:hypothetical protein
VALADLGRTTTALRAVLGAVTNGHHEDTCGQMLNEVHPCSCWKSKVPAVIETLLNDV